MINQSWDLTPYLEKSKKLDNLNLVQINDEFYYNIEHNDLSIILISDWDVNLFDLNKLSSEFVKLIKQVFGDFNEKCISENFVNISIMLDWFIETGWMLVDNNLVLSSIIQREFVEQNKILQVGMQKYFLPQNLNNLALFASNEYTFTENWWSLSNLEGWSEIYFHFLEELSIELDKNQTIKRVLFFGRILCNNLLSFFPKAKLLLKWPKEIVITNYAIHDCLVESQESFKKEKLFYFYPPNGLSKIFNYTMLLNKLLTFLVYFGQVTIFFWSQNCQKECEIKSKQLFWMFEYKIIIKNRQILFKFYFYGICKFKRFSLQFNKQLTNNKTASNIQHSFDEKNQTKALIWKMEFLEETQSIKLQFDILQEEKPFEIKDSKLKLSFKFQIDDFSFTGIKSHSLQFSDSYYPKKAEFKNSVRVQHFDVLLT